MAEVHMEECMLEVVGLCHASDHSTAWVWGGGRWL